MIILPISPAQTVPPSACRWRHNTLAVATQRPCCTAWNQKEVVYWCRQPVPLFTVASHQCSDHEKAPLNDDDLTSQRSLIPVKLSLKNGCTLHAQRLQVRHNVNESTSSLISVVLFLSFFFQHRRCIIGNCFFKLELKSHGHILIRETDTGAIAMKIAGTSLNLMAEREPSDQVSYEKCHLKHAGVTT